MTENEAKCKIIEYRPIVGFQEYREALNMAIQALEEIQQYRAIGTVEELEAMKKGTLSAMELADIWCVLEDLKKYSAIGTIDEFKALKESNCKYWNAEHEDCALSYEEIRAKAIDEFAEQLGNLLVLRYGNATPTEQYVAMQVTDWCGKIAEQMKGGADYERIYKEID